jgi:hypothetical protein
MERRHGSNNRDSCVQQHHFSILPYSDESTHRLKFKSLDDASISSEVRTNLRVLAF